MTDNGAFGSGSFIIKRGSEYTPRSVEWIWKNYLAKRKITLLAGDSGTGKTTLALSWAAIISKGIGWPDNSGFAPEGYTLVYNTEDDTEDTHIPRFIAHGGDLNKVLFLEGKKDCFGQRSPFDPATDFKYLMAYVKQFNHNFKLIIIDPIITIVKSDANQNNTVRQALEVISDLAKQLDCAVIGIIHFAKASQGRKILDRILHSGAFVQVSRVVLNTVRVYGTDECRLIRSKVSNGVPGGGLSYSIDPTTVCDNKIDTSLIRVTGPLKGDPDTLIAEAEGTLKDKGKDTKVGKARLLLFEMLKDDPRLQEDIFTEATKQGISSTALYRAKDELSVVDFKDEYQGKSFWKMTLGRKM